MQSHLGLIATTLFIGCQDNPAKKMDMKILAAGTAVLDKDLEQGHQAMKYAHVGSDEELAAWKQAAEKLPESEQEKLIGQSFPVSQKDYDEMHQARSDDEVCAPRIRKDLEDWFAKWEAYNPGKNPACKILEEDKAALDVFNAIARSCGGSAAPGFSECLKRRHEEFECALTRDRVWDAMNKATGHQYWEDPKTCSP